MLVPCVSPARADLNSQEFVEEVPLSKGLSKTLSFLVSSNDASCDTCYVCFAWPRLSSTVGGSLFLPEHSLEFGIGVPIQGFFSQPFGYLSFDTLDDVFGFLF